MAALSTARNLGWTLTKHPARLIYGNDAWASNNRGQRRLLHALRRQSSTVPTSVVARTLTERVDEAGFALLDPGYPAEMVRSLRASYEAVIDNDRETVDMGPRIRNLVRYVKEPLRWAPAIRSILNEPVRDVLDCYYGRRWRIEHVRMWRIGHIPRAEQQYHHYGNLWHCDHHPTATLKLFFQLGDGVTAAGGAFRFHDVHSTAQIMRAGYLGQGVTRGPATRMLDHPRRVRYFDTPAGTVAFCNTTRCLHRAGIPPEGATRGMVQVTFAPGLSTPADDPFALVGPDTNVAEGRFA